MVMASDDGGEAANAAAVKGMNSRRVNFDHNRSLVLDIEYPGEAIAYLRERGVIGPGEQPRIQVLAGGVSSRTVLIERDGARSLVLKQSLSKLRVAVDWFSSPERIHREALALRWFSKLVPDGAFTDLYFEDAEQHLIAMEAVPQPHSNWKTMLLSGELHLEHVRRFAQLLAALHSSSASRAAELRPLFGDKTFFETLRIEPYYRYTSRHGARDFLESLIDDTLATNVSLVHGDFSPKNVLLHRDRMVLLDHEVAHFGDPAFDIGFAMAHLLSKAHHLHDPRFFEAARLFWHSYAFIPYADFESRSARHSLACLLARVWGRSPLEYLGPEERERQAAAVLAVMSGLPPDISAMIEAFRKELSCR
jgi:aminoglycoside phosphotransferase (APT) family kinase protein